MPYIKPEQRKRFHNWVKKVPEFNRDERGKGELEYVVTVLMHTYLKDRGDICYAKLHDAVYAVMHAAEEFRRVNMDPYEDKKREENGNIVSPTWDRRPRAF